MTVPCTREVYASFLNLAYMYDLRCFLLHFIFGVPSGSTSVFPPLNYYGGSILSRAGIRRYSSQSSGRGWSASTMNDI